MTLLRLGLRLQLVGLAAATVIGSLNGIFQGLAFDQIAGNTPAERALFAQQMEIVARQLAYLLPLPAQLDTLAGYLHWRHFGNLPLLYGFWALIAASGAGRGDEERGLVEQLLATGVGRLRYIAIRWLAFALAAAASIAVVLAAAALTGILSDEPLDTWALAAEGLAILALTLACYGIGLAVAQLAGTRRGAIGIGAIVLLSLFLLNSAARMGANVEGIVRLSPFWQFEQQRPLLAGGGLEPGAMAALVATAIVSAAAAIAAFASRDLGAQLLRRRTSGERRTVRPSRNPLLRLPALAPLWQQRVWVVSWAVGLVVLAVFLVSLTRTLVDQLTQSPIPVMQAYFQRAGLTAYASFVGVIWFSTLLLLVSIYTIAQVAFWSADDAEGRLEAVLATPVSRARVVLERLGSVGLATAILIAATSVAVYLAARSQDIDIDGARFALASVLVLAVVFAFAAIGHAVTGWRPRLAVPLLGAVAVWSYFVQQFAPLFGWPESVENLSLYTLYGAPLSKDVNWGGIVALIVIGGIAMVVTLRAVARRDVGA